MGSKLEGRDAEVNEKGSGNGSGCQKNEEVVALVQGEDLKNLVTKEAIGAAMKEIDANGDGEIDFEEF